MTNTVKFSADRTEFNTWPTSKLGREVLRSEIRTAWSDGPYFEGMMVLGGLQTACAEPVEIPECYPDDMYVELFQAGLVSMGDLQYWARVMSRYVDVARLYGHTG